METVDELETEMTPAAGADDAVRVQRGCYLLELSADWIVLRASENIHRLLRQSHVTLIGEPLGRFVHAQALHDLRNLFSRLSGTTGIARAYSVRLTDENELVDIAFQLSDGHVLLEAVPSAGAFGECFGTVGGLIVGLSGSSGQALLDAGARRMRALTGYDRVTLTCGEAQAESRRGAFNSPPTLSNDLPAMVTATDTDPVPLFPRPDDDSCAADALLRSCDESAIASLRREGIGAVLLVPFSLDEISGEFRCDSRTSRAPSFELHAAAELFAQLFAMQLKIDRLQSQQ